MLRNDFAIFILTHGRPEKIYTLNTLQKAGYTGRWYLILDDEDKTIDQTKEMYGPEHVVVFSKTEASKKFDVMDNFEGRNVIVFARNMCNQIARDLGLHYFAEFEDDYLSLLHRFEAFDMLKSSPVRNFDDVCEAMLSFVDTVSDVQPQFRAIAFAQGGDLLGGINSKTWKERIKRKAMNSFFFKVPDNPDDDIMFLGRMNDDVNLYTTDGMRGGLWFQIADVQLLQQQTQKSEGGNSTAYLKYGTYTKSFYSVMGAPSCVRISLMGENHMRIHHHVEWDNCVPKILAEDWRRPE